MWKGCFLLITKTALSVCWRDLVFKKKKETTHKRFFVSSVHEEGNIFSVDTDSWKKEIHIKNSGAY